MLFYCGAADGEDGSSIGFVHDFHHGEIDGAETTDDAFIATNGGKHGINEVAEREEPEEYGEGEEDEL